MRGRRWAIALSAVLLAAAADPVDRRQIGDLRLEDIPADAEAYGRAVAEQVDTRPTYDVLSWRIGGEGLTFLRAGNLYNANAPYGPFQRIVDLPQRIESPQPALICGQPGFAFSADENGDEYDVIYTASARRDGYHATAISPPNARNTTLRLSPDGALAVYASARRGEGEWALIAQAPCPGAPARVLERSAFRIYVEDLASQGRIVVSRQDDEGYVLYTVDAAGGARTELVRLDQPVRHAFSRGRDILFTTNAWSEFVELYAVSAAGGEPRRLLGDLGGDIEDVALSRDRRTMALVINDNGLSRILVLDAATRGVLGAGLSPPLGVISDAAFTHDGAMLALNVNRDAAPQESGLYDWTQARFTPWSGGVAPEQTARISRPVAFTYASARHGAEPLRISALLHLPEAASENAPAPVVIVAHGGPESQSRATFNRLHNYYATELGVAVILPNIRGSSGYGRSFEQMDDGVRRSEAIDDIGALLDWIAARPDLDADRVVITGGSYGGFVSLSALAAFPDRLRGAISRVGVADIPSFLANTEPYRVANRRLEYGDERDPEIGPALTRLSPLARAHAMTAPILVIHGANDPRVPLQQAEAIVAAVRANGQHAGFLVAGDEGHRFENANNRRWRDGAQVKFIRRTLLDEPQR